jgi:ceramide glucosyltransferase
LLKQGRSWIIPMLVLVFYFVGAVELVVGLWSLWQGFEWLRMVRRQALRHPGFYAPRVAVLCPCKGLEPGLEANLRALTSQDYSPYEVFFILARGEDPAHSVLRRLVDSSSVPAHIVIAGPANSCGEKVNNLRVAVEQLSPEFEVLAFADSDGRPGRIWLSRLVAPLGDARLGATTTYRWTLPERGGLSSALGAAWDASVITMLGEHNHNFCWGGGTAIRRSVFDAAEIKQAWLGALSDDWTMTHALEAAGRRIVFVPESLVPTPRDFTVRSLLEFTNRQITICRVYAPKTWSAGAFWHLRYCATLLVGSLAIAVAVANDEQWLPVALGLSVIMLLAAVKGVLRWLAAGQLLPAWKRQLLTYAWAWTLLAPMTPLLYAQNFITSLFRRRVTWRGVSYEMISPAQTRVI